MSIRKIKQAQLIRVFKDLKDHPDDGFCFLLGAGASVTSGIPSGGELARRWYAELKEIMDGKELAAWHQEIGFDANRVAEFYPQIFERRFLDHPNTGYFQLQSSMKDAEPSIGYSFLAQVLTETHHKFVITTNFDHMVEDAIRTYTAERPLVCGHESLAQYFNARSDRPAIIKVHRDLLLQPFNNTQNTDKLDEAWKATLASILQHYHLVVIGYGGNDGSLMDYLEALDQRKSIYWCCRNEAEINNKIRATLKDKDCIVEIGGFDEFMLALNYAFDYPLLIDRDNLAESQVVKIALAKAEHYKQQLEQFTVQNVSETKAVGDDNTVTTAALLKLFGLDEKAEKDWWAIQLKIHQEKDAERKQELYVHGLQLLPDSAELNGNYALFLKNTRKDYEQAENYYHKALELAPNAADFNGNYALFLHNIRKDYDQAEIYYRNALELAPNHAKTNSNYAFFLQKIRKDYEQAESYYHKALELNPNDATNTSNYANFLKEIRQDYAQAENYYRKALELAPNDVSNNGNYAGFLLALGKQEQATPYLEIAIQGEREDLLLECWFYRLAHYPEWREQAQQHIETLLQQGARSPDWDFSANIERAIQDGYPDPEELRQIAARIGAAPAD